MKSFLDENSIVLSLTIFSSAPFPLLATLSNGECSISDLNSGENISQWKAHDAEVWCAAWKTPDVVLSGADDGLLKLWDLRDELPRHQASNTRYHRTCIAFRI
jgi:WD40 repeat protein